MPTYVGKSGSKGANKRMDKSFEMRERERERERERDGKRSVEIWPADPMNATSFKLTLSERGRKREPDR